MTCWFMFIEIVLVVYYNIVFNAIYQVNIVVLFMVGYRLFIPLSLITFIV